MRKMDLVHIHSLGIEIGKHLADTDDIDRDDLDDVFDEYSDVDIAGPHDVRAQKSTQEDAVFALLDDLTSVIEESQTETESDRAPENADHESTPLVV